MVYTIASYLTSRQPPTDFHAQTDGRKDIGQPGIGKQNVCGGGIKVIEVNVTHEHVIIEHHHALPFKRHINTDE